MASKAAKRTSSSDQDSTTVASRTEVASAGQPPPVDNRCTILALPAELRNEIWKLTLIEDCPIEIMTRKQTSAGAQPPLTRTCRQIRSESLSMFYELNTFRFNNLYLMLRNQVHLGLTGSYVERIKTLQFTFCNHGSYFQLSMGRSLDKYDLQMAVLKAEGLAYCVMNSSNFTVFGEKVESINKREDREGRLSKA